MYLVTGADGFIGSHLCNRLGEVIGWNMSRHHRPHGIPASSDAVFHLGAISSTTETDTRKLADWNILSSCELLERCIECDIPFVYASSASVYGLGRNGFYENVPLTPMNYYAISKASFDMFALQKMRDHPDAKIYGLRYFNVYGRNEGRKGDMASPIHKFSTQARKTGEIKVFEGSAHYERDFVSVEDIVDITIAAKDFSTSGIYNVGTGISRSFLDVANIIAKHTNAKIVEIPFPSHLIGKYQDFTKSDNTKLLRMYNHTFLTLEQGIKKYFDESEEE
jgi:ADP-L-glycero-D-manno-heptose 6-epimerase